jgi:sulfate adenylyltransferase
MIKTLIQPHGGKLVDQYLSGSKCEFVGSAAQSLPQLVLSARNLADLECIATGVYSPLEGFVTELEYKSIISDLRLPNGLAWSIPVTLQVSAAEADKYPLDRDIRYCPSRSQWSDRGNDGCYEQISAQPTG